MFFHRRQTKRHFQEACSRPAAKQNDGPGLANVSGTELTDGWVRRRLNVPHWDPPQAPSFRTGAFLFSHTAKKAPGVPGLEVTKHLEGEL